MGWRTQDACDRDAEKRRRALPWRQRYDWPMLALFVLWLAVVVFAGWAGARM
jgi:polyferredoxin